MSCRALCLLFLLGLPGCCRFAKRDCFPPCDPPKVVTVQSMCELPPLPDLPSVERTEMGCPITWACYDLPNSARLAVRVGKMMDWIREARALCGKGTPVTLAAPSVPASLPTSQPVK